MPIYEYGCANCGHELEVMQKMADAPLQDCPECEKSSLKKKISAVAFRLKGSGWYETDFKTGDKKNLLDADSSSKPEAKSTTKETKSESKAGDSKTTSETKTTKKTETPSKSASSGDSKSTKATS